MSERKVADTPVGHWMMTADQAEWLTEGRKGGPALLVQADLTLDEALVKYHDTNGKFVCNAILTDINDARNTSNAEKMAGQYIRPIQLQFAVALFNAANNGPKLLRKKVAPVLESVIDRCIPAEMLDAGVTPADRFQLHTAIEFALVWFDGTGTPRPPKPAGATTSGSSDDTNEEPTL